MIKNKGGNTTEKRRSIHSLRRATNKKMICKLQHFFPAQASRQQKKEKSKIFFIISLFKPKIKKYFFYIIIDFENIFSYNESIG